jgi:diguanylate cyclase (GGDEF)-like protein
MAVPMVDRNELLGVLLVHAPPGRDLSEYDMRAAKLFAASAASAITKAELLSAARAQASELEHAAYHDTLTGLANRAMFAHRVEESLARTRAGGQLTAVLYLDLDGFKSVNDRLGHTNGDLMLTSFAERLRRCLRTGAQAARLGGDEFAVLLADIEDIAVATVVARRILASVNRPYSLDGREAQITVSIGIAHAGPEDEDATWETLIGGADLAMYDAKRRMRGGFRVFDPSLSADAAIRRELQTQLDKALADDEFTLRYQPIVNLDDGRVAGAEALLRWEHPEHGLLTPDMFLPLAVETGAIVPIGRAVLRKACQQFAEWRQLHVDAAPTSIAVNVSARQLDSGSLIDDVNDALGAAGLPGSSLILELTEDALVGQQESVARMLAELRRIGVRIAIDDFGARYSALGYLLRLPVDLLKADKSFIDGLGTAPESAAVVRTVVELARRLRLETVAEGVETEEQAQALADLGCHLAQGFRFARPLSPEEFDALLSRGPTPLSSLIPRQRCEVDDRQRAVS